jgi:rare lipoprotein A (peptidoglycan hydrolase)
MPVDPVHDSDRPTEKPDSLAARRKHSLLTRASQGLKRRLTTYRVLAAAAVVALVAFGAYTVFESTDTETVALGTGRAGVEDPAEAPPAPEDVPPASEAPGQNLGEGSASFYGEELAGNPTASGERFDPQKLTAAHRTLPLGSRVRVTNLRNGESVIVRINDRGPFHGNRIIDISKEAARRIGMLQRGTARVRIELLTRM